MCGVCVLQKSHVRNGELGIMINAREYGEARLSVSLNLKLSIVLHMELITNLYINEIVFFYNIFLEKAFLYDFRTT